MVHVEKIQSMIEGNYQWLMFPWLMQVPDTGWAFPYMHCTPYPGLETFHNHIKFTWNPPKNDECLYHPLRWDIPKHLFLLSTMWGPQLVPKPSRICGSLVYIPTWMVWNNTQAADQRRWFMAFPFWTSKMLSSADFHEPSSSPDFTQVKFLQRLGTLDWNWCAALMLLCSSGCCWQGENGHFKGTKERIQARSSNINARSQ